MSYEEILQKEGFIHIYTWHDDPGVEYDYHSHKDKVTIFVVDGDVTFFFESGEKIAVSQGQRFDVPTLVEHSAKVGLRGCEYVVGEMIKGDS